MPGASPLSGWVIVLFNPTDSPPGHTAPDQPDAVAAALELDDADWRVEPLVFSSRPDLLRDREREAATQGWGPELSLAEAWRVRPPPGRISLPDLALTLVALPGVAAAWPELRVGLPSPVSHPAGVLLQASHHHLQWLDVDGVWARALPPQGEGVRLGVVEFAWGTAHPDLPAPGPRLQLRPQPRASVVPASYAEHGTNTLGVLLARDDGQGTVGLAPGVDEVNLCSSWVRSNWIRVADAVHQALNTLRAGDVLLVEQERRGMPVEVDRATRAALRTATGLGVIVVEPAGNGAFDLDSRLPNSVGLRMRPGSRGYQDSGAVLVGATQVLLSQDRHPVSCYGARVDTWGPGEGVVSTSSSPTSPYTLNFGHTSGAAAVVAGLLAAAQSARVAAGLPPWTPTQARDALRRAPPQIPTLSALVAAAETP